MLLKFFSPINGIEEPGGLDYILDNPTARVVRGNVEITRAVIDSCPPTLSRRFSAGVVNDLSDFASETGELLLDELELQLLAGRPQESMPWLVVEQTDKGMKENHFVIPIHDLVFEKNLHPYVDRIDQHGFEAWVEHFNLRHGVVPPGHRLRTTPDFEHLRIAACDIDFLRLVWENVETWVTDKDVENRRELEARLIKEGYQVRCNTHAGKPLEQPVILGPRGNQLRLNGSVYYRPDFGLAKVKPLDLSDEKAVRARLAQLREIMSDRFDFRAHHLIGRIYGKKEQGRITLGRARQHFDKLVRKKMLEVRREELSAQRVDYSHMVQVLSGLDAGLEPVILQRKSDIAVATPIPCPHEELEVKITTVEVVETTALVVIPVLEAVQSSAPKADHSDVPPELAVGHSQPAGGHVQEPTVTEQTEVETTVEQAVEQAVETPASVVNSVVAAVNYSDSKDRRPEFCPAPERDKPKAVGGLKQELSMIQKSEAKTPTDHGAETPPLVVPPVLVSVESTGSKGDPTKPDRLPSSDQTESARKAGKKRSTAKKSVRSKKAPISKELDDYPEM